MVGLQGIERKNEYLKNLDMSGREKTVKILKNPKIVENIKNCLNHKGKGSRSMFARQFDICSYILNKVVKQDLKMTKIWVKYVPKFLT